MMPATPENLYRIAKRSARLRWIFLALAALQPIALLCYWLVYNDLPAQTMAHLHASFGANVVLPLSLETRLLALLATAAPAAIGVWIALLLADLFGLYARGRIFETENVRCFRRLGFALILLAALRTLSIPLLSLALTASNPAGQKALAVQLSSQDLGLALVGALVLVIAGVMQEGRRLEEERRLTV